MTQELVNTGRQLIRDVTQSDRVQRSSALGIEEWEEHFRIERDPAGIATLYGNAPELRIVESDQVDPAGRWRHYATGEEYIFSRATGAAWASEAIVFNPDPGQNRLNIF